LFLLLLLLLLSSSLFLVVEIYGSSSFSFSRMTKMDRVGFEPTTSAMPATFYLRVAMESEIHAVQISSCSKRIINILFYYRTFYLPSLIACAVHTLSSVTITKIS
jgi:hypothetical protein